MLYSLNLEHPINPRVFTSGSFWGQVSMLKLQQTHSVRRGLSHGAVRTI